MRLSSHASAAAKAARSDDAANAERPNRTGSIIRLAIRGLAASWAPRSFGRRDLDPLAAAHPGVVLARPKVTEPYPACGVSVKVVTDPMTVSLPHTAGRQAGPVEHVG